MAVVFIPRQLQSMTAGVARVTVEAATVRDAVELLEQRFPGIKNRLCVGDQLSPALQVSVDHTLTSRGLHARIGPATEVHFLPAIGGG